jgi:HSP20 family protein
MEMEKWRPRRWMNPWRPFREMEEAERRFDDLFSSSYLPALWRGVPSMEMGWAPAIDVFEKDDRFVVKAELPGMKQEDIDVSVVGNRLTIKGERKAEGKVEKEDYYYSERSYGSFSRSIDIPSDVDAKKIEANYEDGVLEIDLPKTQGAKPQKVSVSAKKRAKAAK